MLTGMGSVTPSLRIVTRHVLLPAIFPGIIVGLYLTPVALFGCVNRGLAALSVVLLSTLAACVTLGLAVRARTRNDSSKSWWLLTALIFLLPIALVVGPLG